MRRRLARWCRTMATVELAALSAYATFATRPSTPTPDDGDGVAGTPVCDRRPSLNRAVTGGFAFAGMFLGILAAGPHASHATATRDIFLGFALGIAVGTWVETHPPGCRDTDAAPAP